MTVTAEIEADTEAARTAAVQLLQLAREPDGWRSRRDQTRGGLVLERDDGAGRAFVPDALLIAAGLRMAFGKSGHAAAFRGGGP